VLFSVLSDKVVVGLAGLVGAYLSRSHFI